MVYSQIKNVAISAIASAIPLNSVDVSTVTDLNSPEDGFFFLIFSKIKSRRISRLEQTTSDLGYEAAKKIIEEKSIDVDQIGMLVFISRTSDYRSPATAAVLQNRLGLKQDCIAYDVNVGDLGFIYGMSMSGTILNNSNVKYALLIFGDTPSKQFKEDDCSRLLFGDTASALLLEKKINAKDINIAIGTDSKNYDNIFNPGGGFRYSLKESTDNLTINWNKLQKTIKDNTLRAFNEFIKYYKLNISDFDFFSFNNFYSIKHEFWFNEFGIPAEKLLELYNYGLSTSSATPIKLENICHEGDFGNVHVLDFSFGEGMSWGIVDFHLDKSAIIKLTETDECYAFGSVGHEM